METDVPNIVLKHWGISSAVRLENSGGSRATWQLESGDWISRSLAINSTPFRTEATLLGLLRKKLVTQEPMIEVPEILNTLSGSNLATDSGYVWRMTKNIPGSKLPASDMRTYPVLVEALDFLHLALKEMPLATTPVKIGVVERISELLAIPAEAPIVNQALLWLESRLSILQKLPVSVTHGDFNPSNLVYDES